MKLKTSNGEREKVPTKKNLKNIPKNFRKNFFKSMKILFL